MMGHNRDTLKFTVESFHNYGRGKWNPLDKGGVKEQYGIWVASFPGLPHRRPGNEARYLGRKSALFREVFREVSLPFHSSTMKG